MSYFVLILTQAGVSHYYTNWLGGWTDGSNTAVVIPSLSVELPPNTGDLTDKDLEVELLRGEDSTSFLDSLCEGNAVAVVTLEPKIALVPYGPGQTETEVLHHQGYWRLVRGTQQADKEYGKLRLTFRHLKGLLQVPLGISATPLCAWAFGDKTCGVDTSLLTETGTVASVGRKAVFLTDPGDSAMLTASPDNDYWRRGFLTVNGLSIGIRHWDKVTDKFEFRLVSDPPPSWVGETVTLTPGCPKTPEICDSRWSNLEKFGGFGIAIPQYHPVTEQP